MNDGRNLFLDTAVFVRALTKRSQAALNLLNSGGLLYSNAYCMMELRHHLSDKAGLPSHKTNEAIDWVRNRVKILPTPQANQYQKLAVPDKLKSDKPVIRGALDINAVLVTYDRLLLKEARKFVEAKTPEEL